MTPDSRARVVALLRGVNVGGVKVPMGELRKTLESAGLEAQTYLQSGNVLVTPPKGGAAGMGRAIEDLILEGLGLNIRVFVRDQDELAKVVERKPFDGPEVDPTRLHVVFLEAKPSADRVARLDPERSPSDPFHVSGREIYVHYPGGSGRSRFNLGYIEKQLGMAGTARNWNTVTKLLSMLES